MRRFRRDLGASADPHSGSQLRGTRVPETGSIRCRVSILMISGPRHRSDVSLAKIPPPLLHHPRGGNHEAAAISSRRSLIFAGTTMIMRARGPRHLAWFEACLLSYATPSSRLLYDRCLSADSPHLFTYLRRD